MNENLAKEIRDEFQIPPFFSDESLKSYIKEGVFEFNNLVINTDFDIDLIARSLLKNYCFYAFNKKLDEFWENYNSSILRWQFSKMEGVDVNELTSL